MSETVYTLKNKQASKYLPETFTQDEVNSLRTQFGIIIGYTQDGVDFPSHSNFTEIMADPEIEKVHSKTTVLNENKLIDRIYHFVPYCNYSHPYFKDPVMKSVPENADYECTIVLTYVDDACYGDPTFVHIPLVINATTDIEDVIAEIGRYEYADFKNGILEDYWKQVFVDPLEKDEENEDEDEQDKDEAEIEDEGIPFFSECGEEFLCRELNPKNLVAFKIVDIKQKTVKQMIENSDEVTIN